MDESGARITTRQDKTRQKRPHDSHDENSPNKRTRLPYYGYVQFFEKHPEMRSSSFNCSEIIIIDDEVSPEKNSGETTLKIQIIDMQTSPSAEHSQKKDELKGMEELEKLKNKLEIEKKRNEFLIQNRKIAFKKRTRQVASVNELRREKLLIKQAEIEQLQQKTLQNPLVQMESLDGRQATRYYRNKKRSFRLKKIRAYNTMRGQAKKF